MTTNVDPASVPACADRLLAMPYSAWAFGDSVAFEALIEATDLTGDGRYLGFAHGFMRAWASRREPFVELDVTAPGLAMVEVVERTGDDHLLEAITELAAFLMSRPKLNGVFETWASSPLRHACGPVPLSPREAGYLASPPPGVFVDCLHFDPPFFVALGNLISDDDLVAVGVEQALGYIEQLQGADGLFDHFVMRGIPGTFGPGWGRGQGWALLGMLDVIERLELAHPAVATLQESVSRLINAMCALQQDDGHWPSVVTRPDSVPEASTAAFMGAGFLRAYMMGRADDRIYEAGLRAVDATQAAAASGYLYPVSAAVWACTEAEHYCHVPTGFIVPWGEGPLILALAARDRSRNQEPEA